MKKLTLPRLHSESFLYAIVTLCLLIVEICIALFIRDKIIRPYFGDLLVVMLLYAFCKIFIASNYIKVAVGVLIFAIGIEILQYFHFVEIIGLSHNKFATIIIGNKFNVIDLFMYLAGIIFILIIEILRNKIQFRSFHK